MARTTITARDLEAYLEEALPAVEMARIEQALRTEAALQRQLAEIASRRDGGLHSLGEIWRRHRLSCPSREQWGSYLLGALPKEQADYQRFHLEVVGCRYCQANVEDLQAAEGEAAQQALARRRKYFQSSAGYLRH